MAFTMQCNTEKIQLGQIEFLTENREGINATLAWCKNQFGRSDRYQVNVFFTQSI